MRESSKRSSRPTALTVGNYRCFAEPTRMRLAPLTLLYGWNNSGKSALVRMLALLGASVRGNVDGPLNLSIFGNMDPSSLFWKGETPSGESETPSPESGMSIELEWDDGQDPAHVKFVIGMDQESSFYFLRSIVVTNRLSVETLHWEIDITDRGLRRYRRIDRPDTEAVELSFDGLIPPEDVPGLEGLRSRMLALRANRIQWLHGVRVVPDSPHASPAQVRLLNKNGDNAVQAIWADLGLRERAREFFEVAAGRKLDIQETLEKKLRATLTPQVEGVENIDLKDTGEGMSQCLPVVVALAMTARPDGPQILAIEEPESHLHPRVQKTLVDFICRTANTPHRPAVILETHSNTMVLAVQLAISKGTISKDNVCAYWLEMEADGVSRPKEVSFTNEGIPLSNHFRGIFATESEILDALSEYVTGD